MNAEIKEVITTLLSARAYVFSALHRLLGNEPTKELLDAVSSEESLAALREDHEDQHIGTCLDQIIDMFEAVGGFELETTYDYGENLDIITMSFIREHIAAGIPILVGWNDWGGHWQVIIGYDTMGTEYEGDDVIIVADPFDTTDHNQDGYGVYGAERFIYNFTFYDFFGDARTLDTHIKLLRKSLGDYAKQIVTLRGVGYRFEG